MRTVRFSQLIAASGKPEAVTLWGGPERDKGFVEAVKQNRVLTVTQSPKGGKRDFGTVGFHPEPSAMFLVFPKKLKAEADARIVGVKYDLLAPLKEAKKTAKVVTAAAKPRSHAVEEIAFRAVVTRWLKQECVYTIRTADAKAARREALERAQTLDLPAETELVSTKVSRLDKAP